MSFCQSCGTALVADTRFCQSCGSSASLSEGVSVATSEVPS